MLTQGSLLSSSWYWAIFWLCSGRADGEKDEEREREREREREGEKILKTRLRVVQKDSTVPENVAVPLINWVSFYMHRARRIQCVIKHFPQSQSLLRIRFVTHGLVSGAALRTY